jgi:phosphoribosylanthranilate isomerase
MTRIKICGITNRVDALMAVGAGADALGFIFADSPRRVSPLNVKHIISCLPPLVTKVGVFKGMPLSQVRKILDYCSLDLAQFHGDLPQEVLDSRWIKVFELNNGDILEKIRAYKRAFFMLDLPKDFNRNVLDPVLINEIKELGPFILAGRLAPDNIVDVLEKISPYGVDVCRGVEIKPGEKDHDKVRDFIAKVKKWNAQKY